MSERKIPKKSYEQLWSILQPLKDDLKETYWRHKSSGDVYKIHDFSIDCQTNEPLVLYSPSSKAGSSVINDASFIVFSRPLSEFVKKFERVKETRVLVWETY